MLLKTLLVTCSILVCLTEAKYHRRKTRNDRGSQKDNAEIKQILLLSSSSECARECKVGEPAKICYYRFHIELYPVLGKACKYCTPNSTNEIQSNCQCITANGVNRSMLAVNRMFPGPSINVCWGDKVVVDVENNALGMEVAIHWHGIRQHGSPYYDGVPFLTQCPIPRGNIFRYQFIADTAGTHFWYSKSGLQALDGIQGRFIVRTPRSEDPNGNLYDYDSLDHVLYLNDWLNVQATERFPGALRIGSSQHPDSVLINGHGQYENPQTKNRTTSPSAVFIVKQGSRYRFRIINAFFMVCPAELTIEQHSMTVISVDGVPVRPRNVSTIISFSGERYDIVLNANQPSAVYWIQVRLLGACKSEEIQQTAILQYETGGDIINSAQPTFNKGLPRGVVLNPLDVTYSSKTTKALWVSNLKSAVTVEKRILQKPDLKFYIPANFIAYQPEQLFEPNTYNPFLVAPRERHVRGTLAYTSFRYPTSPPLSQSKDLPRNWFCDPRKPPRGCRGPCRCTGVYPIPLGSVVELVIVDERALPGMKIPLHMHGHYFNLMGMGYSPDPNVTINAEYIRDYDSKHPLHRNLKLPPYKDTVVVETGGYVILRFIADNPGYWLFGGQVTFQNAVGLEVVFHVGHPSDLPPVPRGFPVCKNFIIPITPP